MKSIINKFLKYFKESIFYDIYFKWIYWWIIIFFLLFTFLNFSWDKLIIFLIIWFWIMFIYSFSDKKWYRLYNFFRSILIFWWLWLYTINSNIHNNLIAVPKIWIIITMVFFLILMPVSLYILKRNNKLKYIPHLMFLNFAIWLGISNYLWI